MAVEHSVTCNECEHVEFHHHFLLFLFPRQRKRNFMGFFSLFLVSFSSFFSVVELKIEWNLHVPCVHTVHECVRYRTLRRFAWCATIIHILIQTNKRTIKIRVVSPPSPAPPPLLHFTLFSISMHETCWIFTKYLFLLLHSYWFYASLVAAAVVVLHLILNVVHRTVSLET